jgi:hypothetical protein
MNRIALGATAIVVVRQIVAQLHGMAHEEVGVGLAAWQWAFVYSVIVAAPILAAADSGGRAVLDPLGTMGRDTLGHHHAGGHVVWHLFSLHRHQPRQRAASAGRSWPRVLHRYGCGLGADRVAGDDLRLVEPAANAGHTEFRLNSNYD